MLSYSVNRLRVNELTSLLLVLSIERKLKGKIKKSKVSIRQAQDAEFTEAQLKS